MAMVEIFISRRSCKIFENTIKGFKKKIHPVALPGLLWPPCIFFKLISTVFLAIGLNNNYYCTCPSLTCMTTNKKRFICKPEKCIFRFVCNEITSNISFSANKSLPSIIATFGLYCSIS